MTIAKPPRPARMSAKLRAAIEAKVRRGLTVADACRETGLSCAGYFKAQKRAEVRAYVEDVQRRMIFEADTRRGALRAEALDVAATMLRDPSLPAAQRVRLVEILIGEGKGSAVNVQINSPQVAPDAGVYQYRRPSQIEGPRPYLRTIESEG